MSTEPVDSRPPSGPARIRSRFRRGDGGSTDPDRHRRAGRALILASLAAALVGLGVVLASAPDDGSVADIADVAGQRPSATSGEGGRRVESRGYLVSLDELRRRRDLASAGADPYKSAAEDLLGWAEGALDDVARPVQPLVITGTEGPFVDDARRTYGLGLAYAMTGDERYAAAARKTIRAWVDTTLTTADTCPDSGACHTSLIIGRVGPGFAFGADLIVGSRAWTEVDRADLQRWLRDVLMPAASERLNNWGDAGTFLRVVASDYVGDTKAFDLAIAKWRSLVDLIDADGRIPEEVRRGSAGISYTQEALQYKIAVAVIAERRGINLWDYVGARGGSLRAAVDRLAYYWTRPEEWPDYRDPVVPSPGPIWEIVYARWHDPLWTPIILDRRPYGDHGHSAISWTTLTNGIPIEPVVAVGPSPSAVEPSPSPVASSATPSPPSSGAAPTIAGLAVRLGSPASLRLPLTVSWSAPATASTRFEAQRSTDGGSWQGLTLRRDGHSAADLVRAGTVYAYRVRAIAGGNAGPWSTVSDVRADRVEASSRAVTRSGRWEKIAFGEYSGGVALSTSQQGATATWRGRTQAVAIVGPVGPTRGRMTITVDGVKADTISLHASRFQPRVVLFVRTWKVAGVHEVRITAGAIGSSRTVAIDDIVTLRSTVSAPTGS